MALTKTEQVILSSQSNSAGGTVRGAIDVRTKDGGLVTLRITNGGTGPTVPCEGRVLISHSTGTTPATAAAGTDWKRVYFYNGGTTNSAVSPSVWQFGPGVEHIEVEFTGNTGQAVTVEAIATTYSYS